MKVWRRRLLRALISVAGAAVALAALVAWQIKPIARWSMRPSGRFAAQSPPTAPDYRDDAAWTALPTRRDTADEVPTGEPAPPPNPAADVFYVHPTSYVGSRWNAPVDDRALNDATDAVATRLQASAFNACCAVYGPRYRQANGTAFIEPSADGDAAIARAWDDVRRAFHEFQRRRGAERPFIIAAHSQGSVLAERLLLEEVSGRPPRERLVAAYLLGANVSAARLAAQAPDLPPCRAPGDLRCVVAFNARRVGYAPTDMELARRDAHPRLCTNPLTWRDDGAPGDAAANLGAVFLESDDRRPRRGFADARCEGETLRVSRTGPIPRDLPSRALDRVLGEGNLHPVEYQLFYMNLRADAARRVAAMAAGP